MALIDVVKYNGNDQEFVWKFPSEDLRLGTQLVVNNAQEAIFVKNGKIYDVFKPGRYTLTTANIPLLNKLINLPFGGKSPFAAEVWYMNLISKLDNKWGTKTPIQIEDPKYQVVVPLRAFGQFGMRIGNPQQFLETIIGTAKVYTADKIVEYLTGKLLASTQSLITKKVIKEKESLLTIAMHLEDLSKFCGEAIKDEFEKFGIEIVNFFIISINIPEDDPSVKKLKEAKELAMKINTVGRDIYQMDRSFDVMEKAAGNQGTSGELMGAGMGMGLGFGIGGQMGNVMANMKTVSQDTTTCTKCKANIPASSQFCPNCGNSSKSTKPETTVEENNVQCDKCGEKFSSKAKFCPNCADPYNPCPKCGADNPEDKEQCIECGSNLPARCPKCNESNLPGAKFCSSCGKQLQSKCEKCDAPLKKGSKILRQLWT